MADQDARQDIEITILGRTYNARPSWQTLSAIESGTGFSAYQVGIRMMSVRDIGIGEMAVVIRALLQSDPVNGKKAPSLDEIGKDLFENGYRRFLVDEKDEAGKIPLLLTSALKGHAVHLLEVAAQAKGKGEGDTPPDPQTGA